MEAAPTNDKGSYDLQQANNDQLINPNSVDADVPIAQLSTSTKTSPIAPLTPSTGLSGKRKSLKRKPAKYDSSTNSKKKHSPSKHKAKQDPSGTSLSSGKQKSTTKDLKAPVQISPTMIRAREIQSTLGTEHPSFAKTMLRSHVTTCFWMGLPVPFCKSFLPKEDSWITVEDENGQQCGLKFIANKTGLSARWREFAIQHKLHEGDVLIFQLVEPCKFKVYIVRANDSKEVDGTQSLLSHDTHTEDVNPASPNTATVKTKSKSKGRKHSSSPPLTIAQKKHKKSEALPNQLSSYPVDHSMVNSEIQGGSLEPNLSLKDVKTFKDFHILVNKRCIDSELLAEIRKDYFDLCIGKKQFLHDSVTKGLYYKLVAGMIGETVNIANAIKNCKLTTRKEEFEVWDSSLKSFELMGMKVGFLRDRIHTLMTLALESEDAKRYVEVKEEQNRVSQEIKILKAKLVELKEIKSKIAGFVGDLKEKAERYEIEFQKKVDAPW